MGDRSGDPARHHPRGHASHLAEIKGALPPNSFPVPLVSEEPLVALSAPENGIWCACVFRDGWEGCGCEGKGNQHSVCADGERRIRDAAAIIARWGDPSTQGPPRTPAPALRLTWRSSLSTLCHRLGPNHGGAPERGSRSQKEGGTQTIYSYGWRGREAGGWYWKETTTGVWDSCISTKNEPR